MGRYLSAHFGFGIILPTGEDEEWTPPEEFKSWFKQHIDWDENDEEDFETDGWEYVRPDWYEVESALEKIFPVSFGHSYVEDYSAGSAVFAKSTAQSADYVAAIEVNQFPTFEEMEGLKEIAKRFGIPFEPRWVITVSYG